jgi:hypothetical protein
MINARLGTHDREWWDKGVHMRIARAPRVSHARPLHIALYARGFGVLVDTLASDLLSFRHNGMVDMRPLCITGHDLDEQGNQRLVYVGVSTSIETTSSDEDDDSIAEAIGVAESRVMDLTVYLMTSGYGAGPSWADQLAFFSRMRPGASPPVRVCFMSIGPTTQSIADPDSQLSHVWRIRKDPIDLYWRTRFTYDGRGLRDETAVSLWRRVVTCRTMDLYLGSNTRDNKTPHPFGAYILTRQLLHAGVLLRHTPATGIALFHVYFDAKYPLSDPKVVGKAVIQHVRLMLKDYSIKAGVSGPAWWGIILQTEHTSVQTHLWSQYMSHITDEMRAANDLVARATPAIRPLTWQAPALPYPGPNFGVVHIPVYPASAVADLRVADAMHDIATEVVALLVEELVSQRSRRMGVHETVFDAGIRPTKPRVSRVPSGAAVIELD